MIGNEIISPHVEAIFDAVETRNSRALHRLAVCMSDVSVIRLCRWESFSGLMHQENLTLLDLVERIKGQAISSYIYEQLKAGIILAFNALKKANANPNSLFSQFEVLKVSAEAQFTELFILGLRCNQPMPVLMRDFPNAKTAVVLAYFRTGVLNFLNDHSHQATASQKMLAAGLLAVINERKSSLRSLPDIFTIRRQAGSCEYPAQAIYDVYFQMDRYFESSRLHRLNPQNDSLDRPQSQSQVNGQRLRG